MSNGPKTGLDTNPGQVQGGFVCIVCGEIIERMTHWAGAVGDGPRHVKCEGVRVGQRTPSPKPLGYLECAEAHIRSALDGDEAEDNLSVSLDYIQDARRERDEVFAQTRELQEQVLRTGRDLRALIQRGRAHYDEAMRDRDVVDSHFFKTLLDDLEKCL